MNTTRNQKVEYAESLLVIQERIRDCFRAVNNAYNAGLGTGIPRLWEFDEKMRELLQEADQFAGTHYKKITS